MGSVFHGSRAHAMTCAFVPPVLRQVWKRALRPRYRNDYAKFGIWPDGYNSCCCQRTKLLLIFLKLPRRFFLYRPSKPADIHNEIKHCYLAPVSPPDGRALGLRRGQL